MKKKKAFNNNYIKSNNDDEVKITEESKRIQKQNKKNWYI